jgi:hypothetical protein
VSAGVVQHLPPEARRAAGEGEGAVHDAMVGELTRIGGYVPLDVSFAADREHSTSDEDVALDVAVDHDVTGAARKDFSILPVRSTWLPAARRRPSRRRRSAPWTPSCTGRRQRSLDRDRRRELDDVSLVRFTRPNREPADRIPRAGSRLRGLGDGGSRMLGRPDRRCQGQRRDQHAEPRSCRPRSG